MKTGTQTALIVALCLIGAGFFLTIVALAAGADVENATNHIRLRFDRNNENIDIYEEDLDTIMETEKRELALLGDIIPANSVRNLKLDIAAAEVVILTGSDYLVRAAGNACTVKQNGDTLRISSKKRHIFGFLGMPWKSGRIEIVVPADVRLDRLEIEFGAGSLVCNAPIECRSGKAEIGMGECRLNAINATDGFDLECGMGSIKVQGRIEGNSSIECGMGEITMNLDGDPADYAYNAEVGMGSIKINDTEISGMGGKSQSPYNAKYQMKVECGMGAVNIRIGR